MCASIACSAIRLLHKWQNDQNFIEMPAKRIITPMLWIQIWKYSSWKIWTHEQYKIPNKFTRWMLLAVQREQRFDTQKNLTIMPGSILKMKQAKTRTLSGKSYYNVLLKVIFSSFPGKNHSVLYDSSNSRLILYPLGCQTGLHGLSILPPFWQPSV